MSCMGWLGLVMIRKISRFGIVDESFKVSTEEGVSRLCICQAAAAVYKRKQTSRTWTCKHSRRYAVIGLETVKDLLSERKE
jgi:hypothetical protein